VIEDWQKFLSEWAASFPGADVGAGPLCGFGEEGASVSELLVAEDRLGCRLPSSYRSFLRVTNGLRQPRHAWPASGGDYWAIQSVDWFRVRNRAWIEAYRHGRDEEMHEGPAYGDAQDSARFRFEHLRRSLEISHDGDACIYLLNPSVIDGDGEWEAWSFANWHPGAVRYRSFAEMLSEHRREYMESGEGGF